MQTTTDRYYFMGPTTVTFNNGESAERIFIKFESLDASTGNLLEMFQATFYPQPNLKNLKAGTEVRPITIYGKDKYNQFIVQRTYFEIVKTK